MEEVMTLTGHTSWIRYLKIYQNRLISGSCDNTIKIWRFPPEIQEINQDETTYLYFLPPEIWTEEILKRMNGSDWMKPEGEEKKN